METSKTNEYTNCFRNIIFLMKMFAVFPFYPLHEVFNISQMISTLLTFTSITIYACVILHEQKNLLAHCVGLIENFTYMHLMGFIPNTMSKLSLIIAPCVTWNTTKRLRNHRNNWIRFQTEFEKLTKTSFKCSVKSKIQRIFATGMIFMTSVAIFLQTRQWNMNGSTSNIFAVLYLTNGVANVMMYWFVNNMFIISSAKEIINVVQQTINKRRGADLRRLIVLWIMLCDLEEEFISCHSIRFLLLFCLIVISGVIGAYGTVVLLVHFPDKSMGLSYLSATVVCILFLNMFCESANSVNENMVQKLLKLLLNEKINNLDTNLSQMILLFLETIETRNPRVTLNGFMKLDRSTLPSILGTTINFLLIMKQFSPM